MLVLMVVEDVLTNFGPAPPKLVDLLYNLYLLQYLPDYKFHGVPIELFEVCKIAA